MPAHLLVDPLESRDQAPDIIVTVPVVPDILDYLHNRSCFLLGRLCGDTGRLPEIFEQRPAKTVEDDKV